MDVDSPFLPDETSQASQESAEFYESDDDGDPDGAVGAVAGDPEDYVQKPETSFEILPSEEVARLMEKSVQEASTITHLPSSVARKLLNHFRWDKQKLMEQYFGDGDHTKLLEKAGIIDETLSKCQDGSAKSQDCGICLTEFAINQLFGLSCNHRFCNPCWESYLKMKIMEEGQSVSMSCPQYKCPVLVEDTVVMKMVDDPNVKAKYQRLNCDSFVECNRLFRWCPAPGCTFAATAELVEPQCITCICGFRFCFKCGEKWHEPVKCDLLRKWEDKIADTKGGETARYILVNTKECPNCHSAIEKNGGCNHMMCSRCKQEFCWFCLGTWASHMTRENMYQCNRFEDSKEGKALQKSQSEVRAQLERYYFFSQRYMSHSQSLRQEKNLQESIENRRKQWHTELQIAWNEHEFLEKAVKTLWECRQTLMYTYVFAFYMEKNNQIELFEINQKDLEMAIESLSEYLERRIETEEFKSTKTTVQDKYRYCESRRQVLLDHVREGYDKNWWSVRKDVD